MAKLTSVDIKINYELIESIVNSVNEITTSKIGIASGDELAHLIVFKTLVKNLKPETLSKDSGDYRDCAKELTNLFAQCKNGTVLHALNNISAFFKALRLAQ